MIRGSWLIIGCSLFVWMAGCQEQNTTETAPPQEPDTARATEPFPESQVPAPEPQPDPRAQPARVSVATPRHAEPDPTPVDTSARAARNEPAVAPSPQPRENYAPAVKEEPRYHVVRKDETLQKISMKYYNTTRNWRRIYEANRDQIKDPNVISIGMKLRIP